MIKIKAIKVILRSGHTDTIVIEAADLPEPCWPFEGNAAFKLSAATGTGVEYCKTYFPGAEVEVIDARRGGL